MLPAMEIRQDRREIGRDRAELRQDLRDRRQEHALAAQAQRVTWQAPGRQQVAQATNTQRSNGRHSGGQQGRGDSRGG